MRRVWFEYCRDFLAGNPRTPEGNKVEASLRTKETLDLGQHPTMLFHPDDDKWTPDHTVCSHGCRYH